MKRIKTVLCIVIFTLSAIQVFATKPPDTFGNRLAAAQRYLDVMTIENLMLDITNENAKNLPKESQQGYIKFMQNTVRKEVLSSAMLSALAKHFTVDELDALANFYGSEVGKSAMKKFGAYMADVMPVVQQEIERAQKELAEKIQKQRDAEKSKLKSK